MRNRKKTNKTPASDFIKSQNDFLDFFNKWGGVKKKRPGILLKIKNVLILEFNLHNHHYLSDFQEGMPNSNGRPRAPKHKINKRDLEHFVYFRV